MRHCSTAIRQLCLSLFAMALLSFVFYLGIVYIVFSLIWGFFMLILNLFTMGQRKGIFEEFLLRSGSYYFIAALTAMAAMTPEHFNGLSEQSMSIIGLIVLFLYLLGKMERRKRMRIQIQGNIFGNLRINQKAPDKRIEMIFLVGGLALYTACLKFPEIAVNDATLWFYRAIKDIYDAPVIGWIIKLVGVFFLLGIFFRAVMVMQLFMMRLTGQTPPNKGDSFGQQRNDDDFDDFEEIEDDKLN